MRVWILAMCQKHYSRRHTGQHSPSRKVGVAQDTGGHVIWWHTIFDSCNIKAIKHKESEQKQAAVRSFSPIHHSSQFFPPDRYTWCSCPQPSPPYPQRDGHLASTCACLWCSSCSPAPPSSRCSPQSNRQTQARQMDKWSRGGNTSVNVFHM